VVINGHYLGRGNGISPGAFDLGRTGTHEVGHWLGLFHTFQGGCSGDSASNCNSEGDRVCDTPPTAAPNYGCPNTRNSCMESPVDYNDMMVNYMDYGDDACLLMFSTGQKDRMGFFLTNTRNTIWSAPNLTATGCDGTPAPGCYPTSAFTASASSVCVGDTIFFTSMSTGPANSWSWSLSGGTPSSSSLEHPFAVFNQPGIYPISLAVGNPFGVDLSTMDIEVVEAVLPPAMEGFEAANPPGGWYVRDEDQGGGWEQTDLAASEGQFSMVDRNYIQRQEGTADELVSPLYDLSNATDASLVFDYAYKRRDAFSPDTLNILVTTDCGQSWTSLWSRGNTSLPTVPGLAIPAEFVPNSSQWKRDTIDLTGYLGISGLRFMFQCIGGYGQSLYLDRINLDALVTGNEDAEMQNASLEIFPNPFREQPEIALDLTEPGRLTWQLHDLQGRVLHRQSRKFATAGRQLLDFEAGFWGNVPPGLYIMVVSGSSGTVSKKLVKL
jgi:PKD repeat protein